MQNRRGPIKQDTIRWAPGKPCSICGQPVLPEHLSKEEYKLRYEKKWCVHYACHLKMLGFMDRNTR